MTRFGDLYAQFAVPALGHWFGDTVTYLARRTDAYGDAANHRLEGITARQLEQTIQDQPLGSTSDNPAPRIWHVAKSVFTAAGFNPQRGDVLIDSTETPWTIRGWRLLAQGADYELTCSQGED